MGGNESNEKSRNSIPNAENPFSVKPLKDFELKEELKFAYLWYDPRVFQP